MQGRYNAVALAVIAAAMTVGLLYPFVFHFDRGGIGPLQGLLRSWSLHWSRVDFLANVILFAPFGFFAARTAQGRTGVFVRWGLATLLGAAFSASCELLQYFEPTRVQNLGDIAANIVGTALGAGAGAFYTGAIALPVSSIVASSPVPLLLFGSWLCYRLYPYIPAADPHKYWEALKPLVLSPELSAYGVFRYAVMWLTVAALGESIIGPRQTRRLLPLLAAGVFAGKIVTITTVLTLVEVVGAGVAYVIWLAAAILPSKRRALFVWLALFVYVVMWRLEPFTFGPPQRAFEWIPFLGFTRGSMNVNTQSFLEKAFYYGSLVWLLTEAGARLRTSAITAVVMLLATSALEVFIPGRSAEIGDALIAVMIAVLIALTGEPAPKRAFAR